MLRGIQVTIDQSISRQQPLPKVDQKRNDYTLIGLHVKMHNSHAPVLKSIEIVGHF